MANARFKVGPLPDLTVRWVQMALQYLGFAAGGVDGWFGAQTQRALIAFQKSTGLAATGLPDPGTKAALHSRFAALA